MVNMQVDFCGIPFKNPVSTASGTYGFAIEYGSFVPVEDLGSVTTKGLTLQARQGNSGVRVVETPAGMLNCIGLENPGVDAFIQDILPRMRDRLAASDTKIIANISGNTVDEYARMAEKLAACPDVALLEVNISCPNVRAGGMAFGTSCSQAVAVCQAVKGAAGQPVLMKLSPNVTDVVEIALGLQEAGADGLAMINTLMGMVIDVDKRRPVLGNITGGLSGPAVRPVGVRMVWQVAQAVDIPILAMGGIDTARDALEYILAGARMVSVGAAAFADPLAPMQVVEGLRAYCEKYQVAAITDLVGAAWKEDTGGN
ncbi:dihydroorotate dehydrogenase [Peptococcus simiae]|uniref:dihydroorotate dehydrogenase n=1 Tax=Peptococcus simiae TaxID=1643805 RepID=UPI00398173B3